MYMNDTWNDYPDSDFNSYSLMLEHSRFLHTAVISRPKLNGPGYHWGVSLHDGRVFHMTADRGVCIDSYEEFAVNLPVSTIRYVPLDAQPEMYKRMNAALINQVPYHLVHNNCETVANMVTGYEPKSDQVNRWRVIAGMIFSGMIVIGVSANR